MNRRAVAPVIVTLLLVAVAVVGGSIIFVFSQGFFASQTDALYVQEFDCIKWQVIDCTYVGTSKAEYTGGFEEIQFKESGNFLFVIDSERYAIHKYVLDIPFDIRTHHFSESFLWGNGDAENFLKGVKFSTDGDKMYFLGTRGDERVRSQSETGIVFETEYSSMQKIIAYQDQYIENAKQVIDNQRLIIDLQDAIIKGEETELYDGINK